MILANSRRIHSFLKVIFVYFNCLYVYLDNVEDHKYMHDADIEDDEDIDGIILPYDERDHKESA